MYFYILTHLQQDSTNQANNKWINSTRILTNLQQVFLQIWILLWNLLLYVLTAFFFLNRIYLSESCRLFTTHLLSLSHPNFWRTVAWVSAQTIKQLHPVMNICLDVGHRPDRVEAVWLAAENRFLIEQSHIYATSLSLSTLSESHPVNEAKKWITPASFHFFCVLSQPVIKPFLTARWRWRFWLEWQACG